MKFAIGLVTTFEKAGFDVTGLRHSIDGTKVLSHLKFATPIIPLNQLEIYDVDSVEFKELLASPEWTAEEYADPEEVFEEEAQ